MALGPMTEELNTDDSVFTVNSSNATMTTTLNAYQYGKVVWLDMGFNLKSSLQPTPTGTWREIGTVSKTPKAAIYLPVQNATSGTVMGLMVISASGTNKNKVRIINSSGAAIDTSTSIVISGIYMTDE